MRSYYQIIEDWNVEDTSFGYDPNGNLTSQTGKFDNITYDHRNLPTHFDLDGGGDVYAFYNGDGQRVLKEQSASSYSFYIMDGPRQLLQKIHKKHFAIT